MTHEELIALAKEATGNEPLYGRKEFTFSAVELALFAALVAAKEREECAKVCETHAPTGLQHGLSYAAAIRARKPCATRN